MSGTKLKVQLVDHYLIFNFILFHSLFNYTQGPVLYESPRGLLQTYFMIKFKSVFNCVEASLGQFEIISCNV